MKDKNMKKALGLLMMVVFSGIISAQYMIVGKDSISLNQFKKENQYGLENTGVKNTINTIQNFYLFQQFAAEKKADTLTYFREKMADREVELRTKYFFPSQIIDPILNDYVKDNQVEKEVQVFIVEKKEGDTNNYLQDYNDVKSGKLTMEEAISKYTKASAKPIYIKPGSLDNQMYSEIKSLHRVLRWCSVPIAEICLRLSLDYLICRKRHSVILRTLKVSM